jgi:DNA-binding response OmpR family regulator
VAEDSHDTRRMLKRAFELKGYRVLEATNGREALYLTKQYKPSLIIIDLNMPELDGFETIRLVRQLKEGEQVPIVAITAFDVYGMEQAVLDQGGDEYITKPFDLHELDRRLKHLGFVV